MKKGIVKTETPKNNDDVWVIDCDVVLENYNKKNPELRRLTQIGLAEKCGVTSQLFSDWKKRNVKTVQVLKKMAEIGDCTVDELIKKLK